MIAEECLRSVESRALALLTEEGSVAAAQGLQTGGLQAGVAEDGVGEDRVEREGGVKERLLHGGSGVLRGNHRRWISGRFDRRSRPWLALLVLLLAACLRLLLTGCLLLIAARFWRWTRSRLSSPGLNPAVAVHAGASRGSLRCGDDAAGPGETLGRSGTFAPPLFGQRCGEAVEAARHGGGFALHVQHRHRRDDRRSGDFAVSFARARTGVHPFRSWVCFAHVPRVGQAQPHLPSGPSPDALRAPREPEILREPWVLFRCVHILTDGVGGGGGSLVFALVQLERVQRGGGVTGRLAGRGGAAGRKLLHRAAAV